MYGCIILKKIPLHVSINIGDYAWNERIVRLKRRQLRYTLECLHDLRYDWNINRGYIRRNGGGRVSHPQRYYCHGGG